jgi:hypothetical protein
MSTDKTTTSRECRHTSTAATTTTTTTTTTMPSLSYLVYESALMKKKHDETEVSPASIPKKSGNQKLPPSGSSNSKNQHPSYKKRSVYYNKAQHASTASKMTQAAKPVRRTSSSSSSFQKENPNFQDSASGGSSSNGSIQPKQNQPKRNDSMLSLSSSSVYTSATSTPQEREYILYSSFRRRASIWSQKNNDIQQPEATDGSFSPSSSLSSPSKKLASKSHSSIVIMMMPSSSSSPQSQLLLLRAAEEHNDNHPTQQQQQQQQQQQHPPPPPKILLLRDLIQNAGIMSQIVDSTEQNGPPPPPPPRQSHPSGVVTTKSSTLSYSSLSSYSSSSDRGNNGTLESKKSSPQIAYRTVPPKRSISSTTTTAFPASSCSAKEIILWNHIVVDEPRVDTTTIALLQEGLQQALEDVLTMDSDSPLPCTCCCRSSCTDKDTDDDNIVVVVDDYCVYHGQLADSDDDGSSSNTSHHHDSSLGGLYHDDNNNDNGRGNKAFHTADTPAIHNRKSIIEEDCHSATVLSNVNRSVLRGSSSTYIASASSSHEESRVSGGQKGGKDALSSSPSTTTTAMTPQRRKSPQHRQQRICNEERFSKYWQSPPPPPPPSDESLPSRSTVPSTYFNQAFSSHGENNNSSSEQDEPWKGGGRDIIAAATPTSSMQAYGFRLPHGNVQNPPPKLGTKKKNSQSKKTAATTTYVSPLPPSKMLLQQDQPPPFHRHPSISSIRRLSSSRANSLLSYSTMVSEITTITNLQTASAQQQQQQQQQQHQQRTTIAMDILPPLKLNPKAPQYKMAMEQQRLAQGNDNTDVVVQENDTIQTQKSVIRDEEQDDADGSDIGLERHGQVLEAANTQNVPGNPNIAATAVMPSRPERQLSPVQPTLAIVGATPMALPPATKPNRTTTPPLIRASAAAMPERSSSPDDDMVALDARDSVMRTTPPPPPILAVIQENTSPGILTSVEFANATEDDQDDSDDAEGGRMPLQKPNRVSTLTYPSFDPSSPRKQAKPKLSPPTHVQQKEIDLTQLITLENSNQSLYQDEEEESLAGSGEEDIGNRPRHLEYVPSVDGSDMISSYATSSSSSNLTPASLRDGTRKPLRTNSDDEITPPLPPKRIDRKPPLDQVQEMEESMTGPFISPRKDPRRVVIPKTPQQDSNPLLFPLNLSSPGKKQADNPLLQGNVSESPRSPLPMSTSGTSESRSMMARTPQHNSNPLMFPQGLSFYTKTPFGEDVDNDEDITVKAASSKREIEFTFTPSPVTRSKSLADIDLSSHGGDFFKDDELHAPIDLSKLSPEAVLSRNIGDEEAQAQMQRTSAAKPPHSTCIPPTNQQFPSKPATKGYHPSKGQSPKSFSQPNAPRRSVSFPQSVVENVRRNESCTTSSSGTTKTPQQDADDDDDHDDDDGESTTTGGMPSVTSSPYSRQSHSSRFTVSGTDPKKHFELVLHRDSLMEPSVFTEDDSSDDDTSDVDKEEEIVVEEIVEEIVEEEEEEDEMEYGSAAYDNEMSTVEEEVTEDENESCCDDDDDDDDSSMDDVTALDDQSEQYEPLNDEGQCKDDRDNRRLPPRLPPALRSVEPLPHLVSNTSSSSKDSPSVVSSVTDSSSVALLRVRMCPMKIIYILDEEENEYTGFYSGPM